MIKRLEKIFTKTVLRLRLIRRKYKPVNMFCKCCGRELDYDFNVKDKDWKKLPTRYHNHVLCIHCFCQLHPDLENLDYLKLFTNWRL